MGVFFTAVALSITLVISFSNIAQGLVPFQLYVLGNPFETGTRNFTFFESSIRTRIVCYTPWKVRTDVTILKGGKNIENGRFRHNANNAGSYSCHIAARILGKNKAYFSLEIVSYLQIVIVQLGDSLCGTSAGDFGFISERARLYCADNAGNIWWNNTGSTINYVSLSDLELSRVSCGSGDTDTWKESCQIGPGPLLLKEIKLDIHPETFTSSAMYYYFTCTSEPSRLIFWEVLGANGDIFDVAHGKTDVAVNTSITISQHPGYTTLHIEEGAAEGNGIHTVRCYTYDTVTVVAEARVEGMVATPDPVPSTSTTGFVVTISVLVVVIFIMGLGIAVMCYRFRKVNSGTGRNNGEISHRGTGYTYDDHALTSLDDTPTADLGKTTHADTYESVSDGTPPDTGLEDNPAYETSEACVGGDPEYTYAAP